jgi:hypothetical protein
MSRRRDKIINVNNYLRDISMLTKHVDQQVDQVIKFLITRDDKLLNTLVNFDDWKIHIFYAATLSIIEELNSDQKKMLDPDHSFIRIN